MESTYRRLSKQIRNEIRAEHARTGKWPFLYSSEEIKERFIAKRSNLTPDEIESKRQQEGAKRLSLERELGCAEESMNGPLEKLRDFNLLHELIRFLRYSAKQYDKVLYQHRINMGADLLERISQEGYRPPSASVRKRHETRKSVMRQWFLKREYMTVEEFKVDMHETFGISEGTVLKILYPKSKTPRRFKNL